jgi:hypothetical protein
MTRRIYLFTGLSLLILFCMMCRKDDEPGNPVIVYPSANFTFTGGDNPAPHKIIFTNTSKNATSYLWDFGDSVLSTTTDPQHIYQQGGTYTIYLTAYGGNVKSVIHKDVVILDRPTKVKMDGLILTSFPATNNGENWDEGGLPDIYFKITNNTGSLFYTSEVINDLENSQLPVSFTDGMPFVYDISEPNYYLKFYDYDDSLSSDIIGIYSFPLNLWVPIDGSDYPYELTFETSSSDLKFTMTVEWIN